MGCFNSKLRPSGHVDNPLASQQDVQSSSPLITVALPQGLPAEQNLQGVKCFGVATTGDAALLFSRLVIARGHILAAVFEGHVSPSAAEYCRSQCWEAFVQASASRQQVPVAAALRALDRGFLTSSKHSLESRLSSGCSATLLHIDTAARTVAVATVGAHGAVGLGSVGDAAPGPATHGSGMAAAAADAGQVEAGRRGRGSGSGSGRLQRQEQHKRRERRRDSGGKRLAQGSCAGDGTGARPGWGPSAQPLSRFTTLEAPSAECRRGLSGLVHLVQSAMAYPATDPALAALAVAAAAPAAATVLPTAAAEHTFGGGSSHGGLASSRRSTAPGAAPPQALGFGCAKDALLAAAFENSVAAAARAQPTAIAAAATVAPLGYTHAQAHTARLAALSRLHCGCDVRVTSRPLAAGDECLVLLAGCCGAVGRAAVGARTGSGAGSISSGGAGDNSGGVGGGGGVRLARSGVAAGGTASSGQVSSSPLSSLPTVCAPAGALSTPDAVTLAHELRGAAAAQEGASTASAAGAAALTRENRFTVMYDSYDPEAAVVSAAAAMAAAAAAGPSPVGDRSALAVASYAAAAALRNRGAVGGERGNEAPSSAATPALPAACIAIWLNWSQSDVAAGATSGSGSVAGDRGAAFGARPAPPPSLPLSQAARRWDVLRGYCCYLAARRRRILTTWHTLAAAVATLPLPYGGGGGGGSGGAAAPSWAPAQIASALGSGAQAGSFESVTGCGGITAVGIHTASFTSRPPVMMEFVEELPTPAPSVSATPPGRSQHHSRGAAAAAGSNATGDGFAPGSGSGTATGAANVSSIATYAANAANAQLDESHTHSASAAAPYGISGLVMAPMGSTEDLDLPADADADLGHDAGGAGGSGGYDSGGGECSPKPPLPTMQRSFVMPYGSMLAKRTRKVLGLRPSHSMSDMQAAAAAAHDVDSSAKGRMAEQLTAAAMAQREADAVAYARGSAYSHASAASAASAVSATSAAAAAAGSSGSPFDWSLIMASVNQNSGPRQNSAGNTPMPSGAVNRLSSLGFNTEGVTQQFDGGGGGAAAAPAVAVAEPPAAGAGGYLPISSDSSSRQRQKLSAEPPPLTKSPLAPELGVLYVQPKGSSSTSPSGGAAWPSAHGDRGGGGSGDGGMRVMSDIQPPPGVLLGRHSTGDSADGDVEAEAELISEDLPQLRIESTAELAALMAEIIITDDGEVVRTGGGGAGGAGGGGGLPSPYGSSSGRSLGLQHHKGSRALSRQGSRGWQPRLAIVREDAREAITTSTSCSQLLPGEGIRFTAISEERCSSGNGQGSEHGSNSSSSHKSRLPYHSNGTASSGSVSSGGVSNGNSPNGSVEEQLWALGAAGAAAILGPPSVPLQGRERPLSAGPEAAAAGGGSGSARPAAAIAADRLSPWMHLADAAAGYTVGAGEGDAGGGASEVPPLGRSPSPRLVALQQRESLGPSLPLSPPPPQSLPFLMEAVSAADAGGAPTWGTASTAATPRPPWRRGGAVAEAASSAAGGDAAAAAALPVAVGALAKVAPLKNVGTPPMTTTVSAGSAVVENVLEDLWPSLDRHRVLEKGAAAAAGAAGVRMAAASAAVDVALEALHGGGVVVGGGADLPDAEEGERCEEDDDEEEAAVAVSFRPSLAMVGRSRSASASRPQSLGRLRSSRRRQLHQQRSLQGPREEIGDGGAWHAHTNAAAVAFAAAGGAKAGEKSGHIHQGALPSVRHLYGLADPVSTAAAAASRPCSSASVAAPLVQAVYDTAGGGTAASTAQMLDRSWSMGSASGQLCSLLHSTLSKSSMTVAMSTASYTPYCNSTQGSGGRLPTLNAPIASCNNNSPQPTPPLQAVLPLAASAAIGFPPGPADGDRLPRPFSLSSAWCDPNGGFHRSKPAATAVEAADGAAAAAATVLPSLPADYTAAASAAAVSSAVADESATLSVSLQAPRLLDWEPGAAAAVTAAESAMVEFPAAGAVASNGRDYPSFKGSLAFPYMDTSADAAVGHFVQQYDRYGLQHNRQRQGINATVQQHHPSPRPSAMAPPPPRLSRSGLLAPDGGDIGSVGAFQAASPDLQLASVIGGITGQFSDLVAPASTSPCAAAAAAVTSAAGLGFPTPASAALGLMAPSTGLPRPFAGSGSYGTYGAVFGAQANIALAEAAANSYDDGGGSNRSGHISRSDASVWNSTSAWTASTGRTNTDMLVVGGSNRRVLMGGGGGGSSAMMLQAGLAVVAGGAAGGGCGGGDTSGLLLAYNAAYSSVSGLVLTADAGAPGSNTQLLMQMVPPPAAGASAYGAVPAMGGSGAGQSTSQQLFCSPPRQLMHMLPAGGSGGMYSSGGGGGGGVEGSGSTAQMMATLAAQTRTHAAHPAQHGMSQADAQQLLQLQQQQAAPCGDGRAERHLYQLATALLAPPPLCPGVLQPPAVASQHQDTGAFKPRHDPDRHPLQPQQQQRPHH